VRHALTPQNIRIRDNFDAIAPRYDLTNRVISLGIDRGWRRKAVRHLQGLPPDGTVLDLACGTGDMALEVLRQRRAARVVGADLSRTMLGLAAGKLRDRRGAHDGRVTLVNAPAEALPFKDAVFDGVVIAFGIRNVPDFRAGLQEMCRVLRPGGRACILEFSTPPSRALWRLYNYYFFRILPRIGGLLTGREAAYRYLTDSVASFPDAAAFSAAMRDAGFRGVGCHRLIGGIVCIHTGVRP
jgi:demethylmenaquinone methyltransferase/2-methoxy-6-polyprenyl-1,4-benzoquinol methylase